MTPMARLTNGRDTRCAAFWIVVFTPKTRPWASIGAARWIKVISGPTNHAVAVPHTTMPTNATGRDWVAA